MGVDDVTLHYYDTAATQRAAPADRPPLVFIHGASSNLQDAVLAFEKPLGGTRRLIFVDRPGHGYSTRHLALQSDPRRQADLIAKLLSRLHVDNAIVVGHSLGGAVAAAMGLQHGEMVKGLVFLAPATHPWPGGVLWYYKAANLPIIGRVFAWCVATFVGPPRINCAAAAVFAPDRMPPDYPETVGAELSLRPYQFLANAADIVDLHQHVQAMSRDYAAIAASALIITGTQDDVVWPHLHAHGLMRDLPDAKLIEFENCGHMPHHSRNSETVAAIQAFAGGLTGASE
ncbi:alpha/beta fold hydrolase [Pararhizobium sp. IMCC21322]|uniref:alpha/beta fold hydrolase n=1 Tax=Pararhizobium sp. IMCC21322 TaxID=3067903 RepID=UPI002740CB2E|nr:alpha/beta hydrolase [Pararhizobium sp. IMCC21322]